MGANVDEDIRALESARQGSAVASTSSSTSLDPSMPILEYRDGQWQPVSKTALSVQDQLAERRERLAKRKYSDEDNVAGPSVTPAKRSSPSVTIAQPGANPHNGAGRGESPVELDEAQLDMLLDGLDLDDGLRATIDRDPTLKAELLVQMLQAQQGQVNHNMQDDEDDGLEESGGMDQNLHLEGLGEALFQDRMSRRQCGSNPLAKRLIVR